MDKSATRCVMPHLGMALQNESDFCCCNINKASWQNKQRQVMYVYKDPLNSVYQSHTRKMIAAALDNGIRHPSCQPCWDIESAGGTSARINFNKAFGHVEPIATQPRVLIIKPGNTCNYACRMCNPVTSSSWYADGFELEKVGLESSSWYAKEQTNSLQALTFNEYTKTFETVRNSFNSDHEQFWNTLKEWIKDLVYIDIYGGEPFLAPAMFDLLQHGIEIGASKNISIQIHTNASIYNEKYLEILSGYKQVSFNMSMDSIDAEKLEYIRHHGNSEKINKNVRSFIDFFKKHQHVHTNITYTVSMLNVFYMDNDIEQLKNMFDIPVVVNVVYTPEYDIRHLPTPAKSYLISNCKNSVIVELLKQTIPGCDIEWPKFCQATDLLDGLREQSFSKTFPEWWKLLESHWIYKHAN
jgi:organic radical activating enzyme